MVERRKPKSIPPGLSPAEQLAPFGLPQLLKGEDAHQYEALLNKIWAAVAPTDAIEEMMVAELMNHLWDDQRLRQVKINVWQTESSSRLESLLRDALDDEGYCGDFEQRLAEHLARHLPADKAQELASRCARGSEVDDQVDAILAKDGLDVETILTGIKRTRANELTQAYMRNEKQAIKEVTKFLGAKQTTLKELHAQALIKSFDDVERIERLIAAVVGFRSSCVRELDRHRLIRLELSRMNLALGEVKSIGHAAGEKPSA